MVVFPQAGNSYGVQSPILALPCSTAPAPIQSSTLDLSSTRALR